LSATLWTLLMRFIVRALGIVSTLLVARVIPQSEIGAYGVIIILDAGLVAMTSVGFASAIVQMRDDPTSYYDTCWTTDVVRGVLVYAFEFCIAPYWCSFFHAEDAVIALRVLGLGQLIQSFHSVSTPVLMREMKFNRLFWTYTTETFTFCTVTIVLALVLRNRWALVIGNVSSFAMRVIVSYFVHPVRARFGWDKKKAREMFNFTKWILAYSVADFAMETSDNAITARVLGPQPLAQYRMSYQLASEGPATIQYVVTRVAFPAFSSIQLKPESIRSNFRAMLGLVTLTMAPATVALALLADRIVTCLLGPSWIDAAVPLRILGVAMLLRSVIDTGPPILRALNRTRVDFLLKLMQLVVMGALLYPGAKAFGFVGVAGAVLVGAVVVVPVWAASLRWSAGFSIGDFVTPVISPLIAGACSVVAYHFLPWHPAGWPGLILGGTTIVIAYAAASFVLHKIVPRSGAGAVIAGAGR
jgi:O-antigen/teichoic acid export membrane protein